MHLRPPASIVPVRLAAVAAVAVSFAATIRRVLAFFFILRWAATVTVDAVVALVNMVTSSTSPMSQYSLPQFYGFMHDIYTHICAHSSSETEFESHTH